MHAIMLEMRSVLLAGLLLPGVARADLGTGQCHVIAVDATPTTGLQMVAWIEKPDGTYVDTIFVTQQIGSFGLGNRPGRFDFNSGQPPDPNDPTHKNMWPYGRRITTFPIWSHRHG